MKTWQRFFTGLLATGVCASAAAQQVELAPSDAQSCLTMPDAEKGGPDYPFAELKLGQVGRVKIQAEFKAADRAPSIKVLESSGEESFVDVVKAHARTWRVPCLGSSPARLVREFVFKADDRKVFYGVASDEDDAARRAKLECMVRPKGQDTPRYPGEARNKEVQGRVLAVLRFTKADQPPTVELYARPHAELLEEAVKRWVRYLRLPCLGDEPISTLLTFVFRFDGDAYGFKPLRLTNLLPLIKGLGERYVNIDTTRMGCPFDLSFTYRHPFMANAVGSIGNDDAARQPLLELLRGVELNVPNPTLDAIFGDTTTLSVPCIKIDLKPKEKS